MSQISQLSEIAGRAQILAEDVKDGLDLSNPQAQTRLAARLEEIHKRLVEAADSPELGGRLLTVEELAVRLNAKTKELRALWRSGDLKDAVIDLSRNGTPDLRFDPQKVIAALSSS